MRPCFFGAMNTTQKNLLYSGGVFLVGTAGPIAPVSLLLAIAQPVVVVSVFARDKKPLPRIGHALAGLILGILGAGIGGVVGDSIYMALNRDSLQKMASTKHVSKLLELSPNGTNQESSIKQINLLLEGKWSGFLGESQKDGLKSKISQLEDGIKRRDLVRKYAEQQRVAKEQELARIAKEKEERGKLSAAITTYLLDAPPEITNGAANYDQDGQYVQFYSEIKGGNYAGHKYNFRCYRDGRVAEMDAIVTSGSWRNADLSCSLSFGAQGLPSNVTVRDPSDGFVSMRGRFSPQGQPIAKRVNPGHCRASLDEQQRILRGVTNGSISSDGGVKLLEKLSTKISECQ